MNKQYTGTTTLCLITVLCLAGCRTPDKSPVASVASPSPKAAPRIGAVVEGPRFSWSDTKGQRVADVAAQSGAGTMGSAEDVLGQLRKATATLYQKGKPVATMTADKLSGDRKTRKLIAIGNVLVVSHNASDPVVSSVRADQVVWDYDGNKIHGAGNVLVSRGDQVRIPGVAIDADTALQTANITGGDAPITGTF